MNGYPTITLATAANSESARMLLSLFLIFASAKLMAELFERLKQPAVVGEILAGVIIGPQALRLVAPTEIGHVLAELGVMFLLFRVGLETKPSSIISVGRSALLVAILGILLPFLCGWALMEAWGRTNIESLFVGTAMVATSVGITAKVLSGMGLLSAQTSRIILGAAVIDDILGLLVLAVVSGFAGGSINYAEIAVSAALAIGFTAFVAFVGAPLLTRLAPVMRQLRSQHATFAIALVLCIGLSSVAMTIGVAAIIGAFLAGVALAEVTEADHLVHDQTNGVTEFLVPFFLVSIGMQLDLKIFGSFSTVLLALAVTVVAVLTKLVGCALPVWHLGGRRAAQVGVGMMPRGEVGIVVAQIGLALGVVNQEIFGVVLFMAIATTLIAPPLLKSLFAGEAPVPSPHGDAGVVPAG